MIRTAKGTLLKFQDEAGSPATFSTLGQLKSFTQSGPTATVQDVTPHGTGNWMSKLATLLDPGTISGPINYDAADATHQFGAGVWTELINLTKQTLQILFPGGVGQMGMDGFFSSHSFNIPVDNVLEANIEIALTGAITATN